MAVSNGLESNSTVQGFGGNCANNNASSSSEEREYLAQSGCQAYNAGRRHRQDTCWTVAYCLLAGLAACWSIVSFAYIDPDLQHHTQGFYQHSTSCDWQAYNDALDNIETVYDWKGEVATYNAVLKHASQIFLPVTCVAGVLLAVAFVALFRSFALAMVRLSIFVAIMLGLLMAVANFMAGAIVPGVIVLFFVALLGYYYIRNRHQIETTCSELLALAGRALKENGWLVVAAVGIKLAGGALLALMFAGFFCTIFFVGTLQRNPDAVHRTSESKDFGVCHDYEGNEVLCCNLKQPAWTGVYLFFCAVSMAWTVQLVLAIKLYVVADTVAQWYFAPKIAVGSDGQRNASVTRALRHSLTSGFGTVAFSAAVMTLINWLRNISNACARRNVFCYIANACCLQPLLASLQIFTRFATIGAAISGQALVPSAKTVLATLQRNMLQTHSLWWLPGFVLNVVLIVFTFAWTFLMVLCTTAFAKQQLPKDDNSFYEDVASIATLISGAAFLLMFFLLYFVVSLLLDTVNTLYICYAMDRDQRTVTQPEVHAVYTKLPTLAPGSVVQNPDGNVVYGAPEAQPLTAAAQVPAAQPARGGPSTPPVMSVVELHASPSGAASTGAAFHGAPVVAAPAFESGIYYPPAPEAGYSLPPLPNAGPAGHYYAYTYGGNAAGSQV